ncbi:MAG: ArsR/SmtB family transcription factor [Actinomycetota bacterium]
MTKDPAGPVFAALSDPTRRDVVRRLAGGSATATELASSLPITRQAVTKHLASLADAGLVRAVRQGREVRYELTPRPLGDAVSWIADLDTTWAERLNALRDHVRRGR